jgi:transmembrane sensor
MNSSATIRQVAHEWRARMDDGGLNRQEKAEFDAWIAGDAEHAEAYAESELLWHALGHVSYDALGEAAPRNAGTAWAGRVRQAWYGRPLKPIAGLAAMAAAVAVFLTSALLLQLPGGEPASPWSDAAAYVTRPGNVKEITLADGSRVTLGAKSQIDVLISDTERSVRLVAGTAFFDVQHDATRPFVVASGGAQVRVTGTAFDLQRKGDVLYVAVERGSVRVSQPFVPRVARQARQAGSWARHPGDMISGVSLSAGQGVRASRADGLGKVVPAEAGVWRSGQLVYVSAPMEEVAADASRYSAKPIRVDASAEGMKLSGTFDTRDIDGLLAALQEALPVSVEHRGDTIVITQE